MSLYISSEFYKKSGLLKKYDISIEHLSYEYLDKCSDAEEIEKIIIILRQINDKEQTIFSIKNYFYLISYSFIRSGEEGYYPNLIEYAEKKLEKIHPQNKILWIPRSIIKTDKLKHNEKLELKNDITDWIQKMYSIEKSLGHENAIDTIWSIIYPDVRSTKQVEILQKIKKKSKINRIKFCDYNSWDKYDVHVEIKKMDLKVDQKCVEMKRNLEQRKNIIITPIHIDFNLNASLSGIELNQIAEQEKWKGNEAFKVGDYQEALHFYNFCLQMNASNINGYNNRAITFIKLEKYEEALEDCNIVLKIEPTNIKGLLRRALALEKLGNKDQAIVDYIHLLKFQPTNNNAMEALKRLSIKKKQ